MKHPAFQVNPDPYTDQDLADQKLKKLQPNFFSFLIKKMQKKAFKKDAQATREAFTPKK